MKLVESPPDKSFFNVEIWPKMFFSSEYLNSTQAFLIKFLKIMLFEIKLKIRHPGIDIIFQHLWAKNGHVFIFECNKNFKMLVLLEIWVLLEGESY